MNVFGDDVLYIVQRWASSGIRWLKNVLRRWSGLLSGPSILGLIKLYTYMMDDILPYMIS